ncbi:MAG: GAF domain-containing protein, partial [Vicinamibacteria bacterium]
MANIIIWGNTRELISGQLPPGVSSREVATLADLRKHLDSDGGTLVLVDPAHLGAESGNLQAWLGQGGNLQALLVAVGETEEADALLERYPFLDDLLFKPVTPGRIRLRLKKALDAIHDRRVITQLDGALARKKKELDELNKIGVALSAERDINKLLQLILAKSREITAADAGSLYLVERGPDQASTTDDQLRFKLAHNDSLPDLAFEERTMPLNEGSIAGYVALTGQPVNVADAYNLPAGATFQISRAFDQRSGYRTKSVLVVPMKDHQDKVVGAVQLINKKRDPRTVLQPVSLVEEAVIPFTSVDEQLVTSLASQAAVAFENTLLIQDIRKLFESFVLASVSAIEQRDPTTSGHSKRVATLTVGIAEKADALETGPFRDVRFTRDQLQEIRYASLLHDFGKVGVREKVLIKGKKLYVGELMLIRQRMAYIKRTLEAEHLRTKLEQVLGDPSSKDLLAQIDRDYDLRREEIELIQRTVIQANEPTILEEE